MHLLHYISQPLLQLDVIFLSSKIVLSILALNHLLFYIDILEYYLKPFPSDTHIQQIGKYKNISLVFICICVLYESTQYTCFAFLLLCTL